MSSTIGPSAPIVRSSPDVSAAGTTTASAAASAAPPNPALYQAFGTSVFATSALGLRTALNAEDAAIILAEAAMAIDAAAKNASNLRITNAADGRRAAPGQALSDMAAAGTALTGNQASRATAAADLQTKKSERATLADEAATIRTRITDLEARIARATIFQKPALLVQLAAAQAALAVTTDRIAQADREITALNGTIASRDTAIAANRTALAAAGLALLSAFSQIAVQSQSAEGARTQDAVASSDLDRRFDDLADTLKAFRQGELARTETEARTADAAQEEQISRRAMQAALGLILGLEVVLDLLRQADPVADVNPREAALASGQRFQLAL